MVSVGRIAAKESRKRDFENVGNVGNGSVPPSEDGLARFYPKQLLSFSFCQKFSSTFDGKSVADLLQTSFDLSSHINRSTEPSSLKNY